MDERREFLQESTFGILTTRNPGREAHRHWPDELKAQIVSEGLRPGAMVNEVAERQGLNPNYILTWRTMARQGKLVLPAPEDAVEFASVIGAPPASELPILKVSRPEIIVGAVTIRLEEGAFATGSPLSRVLARFQHDPCLEPRPYYDGNKTCRLA